MDLPTNLARHIPFHTSRHWRTIALVGLCLITGLLVGLVASLVNPLILLALVPALVVGVWALRDDERSVWLVVAVIAILPRFATPVKFVLTPTFLDLMLQVGVDRIMFSTDHPYASMTEARAFLDKLPVSTADQARIAHGNAERLLGF